jgi:hypothetical protein
MDDAALSQALKRIVTPPLAANLIERATPVVVAPSASQAPELGCTIKAILAIR